jgi:hypothetical protein
VSDDRFAWDPPGDLTAEWDEDALGWYVDGELAGPAGLASAELPEGVEFEVDVAEPFQIVSAWVPGTGDTDRAKRAASIASMVTDALGRLALAEDVLDRAFHPSDEALAFATIDRGVASRGLADVFDRQEVEDRVAKAIEAAHTHADDLFTATQPDLVADALRFLSTYSGPEAELDVLIDALDEAARSERLGASGELRVASADMVSAPEPLRSPEMAPVSRLLDIVDLDALPSGLRPEQLAARATTASELEIRVGALVPPKQQWWVRVYRDEIIVAAAPILADGPASGVARLLVPPVHLHDVEVDIAAHPDEPRPSRTARSIDRAVRQGRVAARAERTQQDAEASEAWRRCAQLWDEAGDKVRSVAARDRSRGAGRAGTARMLRGGPLLSDLVDE